MKTMKTGGDHPKSDFSCQHKQQGFACECKRGIFHKLGRGATKIKIFLKKHFPRRIWPTKQEGNKGPKF